MRSMRLYCCVVSLSHILVLPVIARDGVPGTEAHDGVPGTDWTWEDYIFGRKAVSTTNLKTEGLYGNLDSETAKMFGVSITAPISRICGIQVDVLSGEIDPDDVHGIGFHGFLRNSSFFGPTSGLFGLTASNIEVARTEARRIGIESESYVGQRTIAYYVGHQSGDVDDSWYGGFKAQWYLSDDLMLSASVATSDGFQRYTTGVEYQTPLNGLACFANLATGEDDYDQTLVGLRFYFGGEEKTLIERHREDNPANSLFGSVIDTFMALPTAVLGAARSGS